MTSSVWSACVWPETHSKSTAVESCSVKYVWQNIGSIPTTVLNVEHISIVFMIKKVILFIIIIQKRNVWYHFCISGERDILSLITQCDNTPNGCEWVGELRLLDEHLVSCDFTFLPCPNKCYRDREGKKPKELVQLFRKDMEKHLKVCPRRHYKCPHCQEAGEY